MLQPTRKATPRGRSDDPSLLVGPDALTGDMRPADMAYVLGRIRFRNGLQTIARSPAISLRATRIK